MQETLSLRREKRINPRSRVIRVDFSSFIRNRIIKRGGRDEEVVFRERCVVFIESWKKGGRLRSRGNC